MSFHQKERAEFIIYCGPSFIFDVISAPVQIIVYGLIVNNISLNLILEIELANASSCMFVQDYSINPGSFFHCKFRGVFELFRFVCNL